MQHIFCIPGLGADFRIFNRLKLTNAQLHPIQWPMPLAGEKLEAYAARIAMQLPEQRVILLGVSFGGMLATEIAKIRPGDKTIIISSAKCRSEIPVLLRAAGRFRLHKTIPYWMVTRSTLLNRIIFDTRSRAEELYLKRLMLQDTDHTFLKRAVDMILRWQSKTYPPDIVHIHGSRDKLLTPGPVKADYVIAGGGHFMVWNMADAISSIIQKELTTGC